MRTPSGALVGLAVLLLLVAVVWGVVAVYRTRPARHAVPNGPSWFDRFATYVDQQTNERSAAADRKARGSATWQSFSRQSDQEPTRWDVGIELIAADGVTVLDSRPFKTLHGNDAMVGVLDAEGEAQAWASQLNAQTRRPS